MLRSSSHRDQCLTLFGEDEFELNTRPKPCIASPRFLSRLKELALPDSVYSSVVVESIVTLNAAGGDTFETTLLVEFRSFAEVVDHMQTRRDQQLTVIADAIAIGQAQFVFASLSETPLDRREEMVSVRKMSVAITPTTTGAMELGPL